MLVLLLLSAAPAFSVPPPDGGPMTAQQFAEIRCGGAAREVHDAGVFFECVERPGDDLTDLLWKSDFAVIGTVKRAAPLGRRSTRSTDLRVTVEVERTFRGKPSTALSFDLAVSRGTPPNTRATKGDRAIWVLMRGGAQTTDLVLGRRVDLDSPERETYVATLNAEATCSARPEGACFTSGAQCRTATQDCGCELPCMGGAPPDPLQTRTARWVCRPRGCAEARPNGPCPREGMTCEGCWGTVPWLCRNGRWRYTEIGPVP